MSDHCTICDSGAFSVWSRGEVINLDQYIEHCQSMLQVTYYVALDVIPGKPNDIKSMTTTAVEEACQLGFKNYIRMLKTLPIEKTLPVFHQGDSLKWLEKYMALECPFIGISPANDKTSDQRIRWLETLRPIVCHEDGSPKVKMHGFAVTGHKVMCSFPFYSVDSATWVRLAGLGRILVPKKTRGEWDYSKPPWNISVSECSPTRSDRGQHLQSLSPLVKENLLEYLKQEGVGLGEWKVRKAVNGEKPNRKERERWWSNKHDAIIEIVKRGVQTDDQRRKWLNMRFFMEAEKVLPLEKIFLAGMGIVPKIERACRNRLYSYLDVTKNAKSVQLLIDVHCSKVGSLNASI